MDMAWLIPVLIVVALVVIVGIYLWATYNSLVALNVRVDEAWSDITVQLKRRADLLPNLIETVKGYAAHEKAVFENVTRARAETLTAGSPAEAGVAEGHMQQALKSLFAVAEAYRSCRRVRTSSSCSSPSSTPRTRSRRPAASTTAACAS
jgi:LemA protein